jgi:PIN domain nuclease of toxin-antitoxin system
MQYLLDTVAIVRHFSEQGKIGKAAAAILDQIEQAADIKLVISTISLMEIMYLAEKNRIPISLQKTLASIRAASKYTVVDLSPEILEVAETITFPELHDRLILATAKWLDIPVISSDGLSDDVPGIITIGD